MASNTETLEKERVSTRVSKDLRERLEEAADCCGATLSQFLLQAGIEKADVVLERERVTRLSARDAKWLLKLLDQPPVAPNERVRRGLKEYDEATGGDPSKPFVWPARAGTV